MLALWKLRKTSAKAQVSSRCAGDRRFSFCKFERESVRQKAACAWLLKSTVVRIRPHVFWFLLKHLKLSSVFVGLLAPVWWAPEFGFSFFVRRSLESTWGLERLSPNPQGSKAWNRSSAARCTDRGSSKRVELAATRSTHATLKIGFLEHSCEVVWGFTELRSALLLLESSVGPVECWMFRSLRPVSELLAQLSQPPKKRHLAWSASPWH